MSPDPNAAGVAHVRTILDGDGLQGEIVILARGQTIRVEPNVDRDHLIFVVSGQVEIEMDDLTCVLRAEEALQIPKEKPAAIGCHGHAPAKLLRLRLVAHSAEPGLLCSFPR
jgi:quercetin dioxygenase-like cupin family protein